MAGIEAEVLASYVAQLKASNDAPAAVAEKLGVALAQEKLPKVDELVALYSDGSGDTLT